MALNYNYAPLEKDPVTGKVVRGAVQAPPEQAVAASKTIGRLADGTIGYMPQTPGGIRLPEGSMQRTGLTKTAAPTPTSSMEAPISKPSDYADFGVATLRRGAGPEGSDLISDGRRGMGFTMNEDLRQAEVARQAGESAEFARVADRGAMRDQIESTNRGIRSLMDAANAARQKLASGNLAQIYQGERELAGIAPLLQAYGGAQAQGIKSFADVVTGQQTTERSQATAESQAASDKYKTDMELAGKLATAGGRETKESEFEKTMGKMSAEQAMQDALATGVGPEEAAARRKAGQKPEKTGFPGFRRVVWTDSKGRPAANPLTRPTREVYAAGLREANPKASQAEIDKLVNENYGA